MTHLSTEFVLAFSLLFSGSVGAFFTAARLHETGVELVPLRVQIKLLFARPLVQGASAGLTSFLMLRGGSSIFAMDLGPAYAAPINPYAASFVALLSGLFTERAFTVLSKLVDDMAKRVGQAEEASEQSVKPIAGGPSQTDQTAQADDAVAAGPLVGEAAPALQSSESSVPEADADPKGVKQQGPT